MYYPIKYEYISAKSIANLIILQPDYRGPGCVRIMKKVVVENLVTHSNKEDF